MLERIYQCKTCLNYYTSSNFIAYRHHESGLYLSRCNRCKSEYDKLRYKKNRDSILLHRKSYQAARREEKHKYDKQRRNSPVLYETYKDKLTPEEECIRSTEGFLQVRCATCNMYFTPNYTPVQKRVEALNSLVKGESKLYCCKECKLSCTTYKQRKYNRTDSRYNNYNRIREFPQLFRDIVLKLDNYECQMCGSTKDLKVHHLTPVKISPMEQCDILNAITLCKRCHNRLHRDGECSIGKLGELKCPQFDDYIDQYRNYRDIVKYWVEFYNKQEVDFIVKM
jgi:5-methylcytosine-specific restriction endonuclease McrA